MDQILLIDGSKLPQMPKAVRDYVDRYFQPTTIFGRKAFVAIRQEVWGNNDHICSLMRKGYAPANFEDIRGFVDGLTPGSNINQWIAQNEGRCVWVFQRPILDEALNSPPIDRGMAAR